MVTRTRLIVTSTLPSCLIRAAMFATRFVARLFNYETIEVHSL